MNIQNNQSPNFCGFIKFMPKTLTGSSGYYDKVLRLNTRNIIEYSPESVQKASNGKVRNMGAKIVCQRGGSVYEIKGNPKMEFDRFDRAIIEAEKKGESTLQYDESPIKIYKV